jgi:transcriptional regulator with GAF, ATPase, and Fis domain
VSVLDQFREAEQRVAQRLKELEPAVAEYRQLQEVAERLGIDTAASTPPAGAQGAAPHRRSRRRSTSGSGTSAASAKPTRRRSRNGATPGQRQQQLLDLVRNKPGITVKEAATELGVDPTGLYRVVRRLEEQGDVRKDGRALQPANASA